jgi:hypothetical protein
LIKSRRMRLAGYVARMGRRGMHIRLRNWSERKGLNVSLNSIDMLICKWTEVCFLWTKHLAYCPYLEKIEIDLGHQHALSVSLCSPPPFNFRMPEPIFTKLGMYVMAPELISTAHFINLYVYPSVFVWYLLCKNVMATTNTRNKIRIVGHFLCGPCRIIGK